LTYPKRLIEVDLPIKAISAHARREKSIRHGHISTLHIWWARRPLAACRAVLCAALWPDPADEHCPPAFRQAAALAMAHFADQVRTDAALGNLCAAHWTRWVRTTPASLRGDDPACWPDLRYALLDFIADFANWDASTVSAFLDTARLLTHVAHLALSGQMAELPVDLSDGLEAGLDALKTYLDPLPRPLVVDPFAGGGSIPLEALRVGADAFASDLNPVAVLLNKVVLEYIPKYGSARIEMQDAQGQPVVFEGLASAVRYWGEWIKGQAEQELAAFYPKDPDGATPIAYLWARTITCEGPGCGAEVPLMRSLWLAKKGERSAALQMAPDRKAKRVAFAIIQKQKGKWVRQDDPEKEVEKPSFDGTVRRGSATCPVCGYTTPVEKVREQLKARHGGATDARLIIVVTTRPDEVGRSYRLPNNTDLDATLRSADELDRRKQEYDGILSLIPNEVLDIRGIRHTWGMIYGLKEWGDLFTPRQALALTEILRIAKQVIGTNESFDGARIAVLSCIALNIGKIAELANSLCVWEPVAQCPRHLFTRQAVPMVWDFAEGIPIGDSSGSFAVMIQRFADILGQIQSDWRVGQVSNTSATVHPLPTDSVSAYITDPPYYDAVPYAHLSDFFYVWLRRILVNAHPDLFATESVPKDQEIVVDRPHELSNSTHNIVYYERELTKAFAEGRRVLSPDGIGTIVFASKTTASWEAILQAVIDAGWVITGSWPIDTEMETRVAAQGQARLASSIHLVCRPRPDVEQAEANAASWKSSENIGDWRDVLAELPPRIHSWLPHLAQEGVVGADAIFACLGPALEIFSRYSRVEKASGAQVTLKEYLEVVWAAVAREALGMIFEGADATGFEEDARLTAMWLWTLNGNSPASTGSQSAQENQGELIESDGDADDEEGAKPAEGGRYVLEYDAARKIAQGLGAHLERLENLVEVKGDKARLLPVSERARALFGRQEDEVMGRGKKKDRGQMSLFAVLDEAEAQHSGWTEQSTPQAGATSLDRLHQTLLLFAAGRSEALKRFLVDDGVGKDQRFWRLAQALSALYPSGSDEKRWVDGVLARKKGLGF